jgi:hypothetical protein
VHSAHALGGLPTSSHSRLLYLSYLRLIQKFNIKLLLSLFRSSFELRKSVTFLTHALFLFSRPSPLFSLSSSSLPSSRLLSLRFRRFFNPLSSSFSSPSSSFSLRLFFFLKRFSFTLEKSY